MKKHNVRMMWGILAALFFNSWSTSFSQAIDLESLRDKCDPNIAALLESSPVMKRHFVGFALYDEDQKQDVCTYNADKYFTVASNTKLLSFYTGLKMLGETLPALRYVEQGDSLIFWGTGDPSLLHPVLKGSNAIEISYALRHKSFITPQGTTRATSTETDGCTMTTTLDFNLKNRSCLFSETS